MKDVSIIIINYKGWEDTIECMDSLLKANYPANFRIHTIIVDNCSQDESTERINEWIDINAGSSQNDFFLIVTKENLGFSGGNNFGVSFAKNNFNSDYFMLLNNDTTVHPDFFEPLVTCAEKDTHIGIVGPEIHDYYSRDNYILGGYLSIRKGSGYHYYNTRKASGSEVSFLSGCAWLIRKEAMNDCGMMDENYFLYVEDVDYCYRMIHNGYTLVPTSDSIIYHKEGRSTKVKPSIYYYNTRNRLYFESKVESNISEKAIFYVYFMLSRCFIILTKPKTFKYIIKGLHDYYKRKYGVLS